MAQKVFDFFSSIKLAVILLISMSLFFAYGTFYEATYGTQLAQKLVYHSWFSILLMVLLVTNLACAVIDRYPWKKHHIGFIITHIGIITMIFGSYITQQRGLDGSIYLGLNEKTQHFIINDTQLKIYQSLDDKPYSLLTSKDVDFDKANPLYQKYNFKLVDDDVLKITKYIPFAKKEVEVKASENKNDLPAVKFKIFNPNVEVEEWIGLNPKLSPFFDFGPALIIFTQGTLKPPTQLRNQFVIYQEKPNSILKYAVYSVKQKAPIKKGILQNKKTIDTGWMNLKFQVENLFLNSNVNVDYKSYSYDEPQTTPVILAQIGGRSDWFELDAPHQMKGKNSSYFISYIRKRFELGFLLELKKFKMGLYQGSQMPSSYESTVSVNGNDQDLKTISMNEPLKNKGLTLYQSSFESNDRGEPIASIFSVNYDPGRYVKYLGAILIVCGIITMFYIKPRWSRKPSK